jgi:outer membrane protein TolC
MSVCSLIYAAPSLAQGPIEPYLRSVASSFDVRRASHEIDRAAASTEASRASLLPSLSATASYARNEHEVAVDLPEQRAVITPHDQLELTAEIAVPIVDAGAWLDLAAASDSEEAARHRLEAALLEARVAVVAAYYELVAARATEAAAREALASREHNAEVARARLEAGIGSEVDEARAVADVARAGREIAAAVLRTRVAERNLFVLTRRRPSRELVELDDDLRSPPSLDRALARAGDHPAVRAAEAEASRADTARSQRVADLFPTVSAFASERVTNAAGFGESSAWTLGVRASFRLGFAEPAAIGASAADLHIADVEVDRAVANAETQAIEAWHRTGAAIAAARAARAELDAFRRARDVARSRFEAGTGSQADLLDAERDLFSAEAARIAAYADLHAARRTLSLRSLGGVR